MQNEPVPWEVMPEVFKCSVQEMKWRLISRTEISPHFSNRTLKYLRQSTFLVKLHQPEENTTVGQISEKDVQWSL